ncbi:MAG TPA: helix-turn-helix domain-containing protein [Acidimicrobiales bacterium]|jgi:AcrR family transcriptional regulator
MNVPADRHAPARRRDPGSNLARILSAAGEVFAEQGYDASMEQVAERANVGIGTLYRRFPSKAALVSAVVRTTHARTRQIAVAVLAECPAADGVFEFLRRCIATPSCWRVITARAPGIGETARHGVDQIVPVVDRLLENARRSGAIRPDVVFADLAVLLMSVRAVADFFDPQVPASSARHLELAMAGLRPDGAGLANPPMTTDQLTAVLGGPGVPAPSSSVGRAR